MNLKQINQFCPFGKGQPEITGADLERLQILGFIVPSSFAVANKKRVCEISNISAGDVVSYTPLSNVIKADGITQDDARRLIVLETMRQNGEPRETILSRLLKHSFAEDREKVLKDIENKCNAKAK